MEIQAQEREAEERFLLYIDILNFTNLVAQQGKVEEVYEIISHFGGPAGTSPLMLDGGGWTPAEPPHRGQLARKRTVTASLQALVNRTRSCNASSTPDGARRACARTKPTWTAPTTNSFSTEATRASGCWCRSTRRAMRAWRATESRCPPARPGRRSRSFPETPWFRTLGPAAARPSCWLE